MAALILGVYSNTDLRGKGPWLFRVYVGDEILPSYIGVIS